MKGLLDFVATPEGQGLLSAAFGGLAGARRGQPLNSIGRAGLAGLAGYSQAQDRIGEAETRAQNNELRQMQVGLYKRQMSEAEAAAAEKARIDGLLRNAYAPVSGTDANARTGIVGPRPEAAEAIGSTPQINFQQLLAQGVPFARVKELADSQTLGMQKVARTVEKEGANGQKWIVQLDEFGREVGPGMAGYVAPVLVDTGDKKMFAKPTAGQQFAVGMSPAEIAANARGWADIKTKQDANDINRTAARTQVVEGADGNVYLVDKGTGLSRPTATLGGQQIRAGKAAEDGMKRTRDASDGLELVKIARDLLPGATGSGVGAAVDSANRFVGVTTDSAQKAAKLEAIGGQLVMKMPRMEGPQSNLDQLLYREMAGKVGDRTVPVAEREAALQVVEQLYQKYSGAPVVGPSATNPAQTPAPTMRWNPQTRKLEPVGR